MKRAIALSIIVGCAMVLMPSLAAETGDASIKDIQAVLDAQIAAWNKGDIDGYMAGYWHSPDMEYVTESRRGTNIVRGWQPLLDSYHRVMSGGGSLGLLEVSDVEIRLTGKDIALVTGKYRTSDNGKEVQHGVYTLVVRKLPEGWRTVYDRTSFWAGCEPPPPPRTNGTP